jgi:hypothetical protein
MWLTPREPTLANLAASAKPEVRAKNFDPPFPKEACFLVVRTLKSRIPMVSPSPERNTLSSFASPLVTEKAATLLFSAGEGVQI